MVDDSDMDKLLLRVKAGNEHAFKLVYQEFHQVLYGIALKYLRNKELAEDAVHDVFIKLWNNRRKLSTTGSLKGFLFTATKNHVLNMLTSNRDKVKKHILIQYEQKMDLEPHTNVNSLAEYRELCREAAEHLPDRMKEVFELRSNEGLTNQEVAEYLGISENTVKVHYYKATTFIRDFANKNKNRKTGS